MKQKGPNVAASVQAELLQLLHSSKCPRAFGWLIGLFGKRYSDPLEYYSADWYTLNHGKYHHYRNHQDAGNHP